MEGEKTITLSNAEREAIKQQLEEENEKNKSDVQQQKED